MPLDNPRGRDVKGVNALQALESLVCDLRAAVHGEGVDATQVLEGHFGDLRAAANIEGVDALHPTESLEVVEGRVGDGLVAAQVKAEERRGGARSPPIGKTAVLERVVDRALGNVLRHFLRSLIHWRQSLAISSSSTFQKAPLTSSRASLLTSLRLFASLMSRKLNIASGAIPRALIKGFFAAIWASTPAISASRAARLSFREARRSSREVYSE